MEVAADATTISTSAITLPPAMSSPGDLTITPDEFGVKPVVTTKEITLNIYDEVNQSRWRKSDGVAADATTINTSAITLPAGYGFIVTGDSRCRREARRHHQGNHSEHL